MGDEPTPMARGVCRGCGTERVVLSGGTMRHHHDPSSGDNYYSQRVCYGSGCPPRDPSFATPEVSRITCTFETPCCCGAVDLTASATGGRQTTATWVGVACPSCAKTYSVVLNVEPPQ